MLFLSLRGWVPSPVGFRYYPATAKHPPFRIFYPTQHETASGQPFRWMQEEHGAAYYLNGYLRYGLGGLFKNKLWLLQRFGPWLAHLLAVFFPGRWRRIPNVVSNAPLPTSSSTSPLPVVVFSHGLTGTGQENTVLLSSWASLGLCIVSVHHTDGSSSCVPLADGTDLYYDPGPPFSAYDANFRPNQVQHRARELLQTCDFVTQDILKDTTDPTRVAVAGFSYGAATAARAIAMAPDKKFCASIFLDGWFYIDVGKSAGIEFSFPKEAFEYTFRPTKASFFCNSESFTRIPKLWKSTTFLANKALSKLHVIAGTRHQNFCDLIFWLPAFLSHRPSFGLGTKHPADAFREIVDLSSDFLTQHVVGGMESKDKAE